MKRSKMVVYPLMLVAFLLGGCSSGPDMKEGQWEITTEMGVEGLPFKMPAMTMTQCLTKDDLIPRSNDQSEQKCRVEDEKVEGDSVSWKMVCKDGGTETVSEGRVTYSGVLFSGKIEVTVKGGPMAMTTTSTINGKYLGACQ